MIIIYVDKPSIAKIIAKNLEHEFQEPVVFVISYYFANVLPVQYESKSYIREPLWKINHLSHWKPQILKGKELFPITLKKEDISNAKVIFTIYPEATDLFFFSIFMEQMSIQKHNVALASIINLTPFEINEKFTTLKEFDCKEIKELTQKGEIYHYFNYLFEMNSRRILNQINKNLNIPNITMSKYMLQLLYYIKNYDRKLPLLTEGKMVHIMSNWQGTGQYSNEGYFGSVTSRASIIENLQYLQQITSGNIQLTSLGMEYMNCLSPVCEDPDLCFKLFEWSNLDIKEAKSLINEYIKNLFQSQESYYSNNSYF